MYRRRPICASFNSSHTCVKQMWPFAGHYNSMDYHVASRLADDYQDTKRPNVLVIMTDQQTCNTIGAYGNTTIRTPNLDRLAAEGVLFERSYTTCPLCVPARASLLSGRYTHNTSAPVNDDDARMVSLEDHILTFGDVFKQEGYKCGYFGKWHIGREGTPQHGFTDGWFTHLRNSYENWLERTGQFTFPEDVRSFDRRGIVPYELAHDTQVTSRAIDFIKEQEQEPFLCFCSMRAPHDPFIGPFDDLYGPRDIPLPENINDDLSTKPFNQRISMGRRVALRHNIENQDAFRKVIARYWGLVHLIDVNVGRLLQTLDERGLTENTLVMFAVDHGEMMGAHGLLLKGPFMYEETNRVPFIMRYPHHIPPGFRSDSLVSMIDYAPTLLDYAELHSPSSMEGRSLRPLIDPQTSRKETPFDWRDAVFAEHYESYTQRCPIWNVTTDQWKYNYYFGDIDELYNLSEDPYEINNLAQDPGYRNILFELRERLREWAIRTKAYSMVDVLGFADHMVTPGVDFR